MITYVYLDAETWEWPPVIGRAGHVITWLENAAGVRHPSFLWREAGEDLVAWETSILKHIW